jgi:hypothetical protein
MPNSLSGHTAGTNDSLKDGSHILSPSLTNIYEALRGNGIMLLQDGIADNSDRNAPANLPGAMVVKGGTSHVLTVTGGHVVIDNVVYSFAGGPGSTQDVTINKASSNVHKNGSFTALTSGQECLFVVYLCTDGDAQHIHFEQGTAVTASSAYPTTPSGFLSDPDSSLTVKQSIVLATLRATFNETASGTNTGSDGLEITISEINDKRHFLRPSPLYLVPMTGDSSASVDSNVDLDNFHSSSSVEQGDFSGSDLGALWMSRGPDDSGQSETNDVLYFSGYQDGGRRTFRLGPNKLVTLPSGGGTSTFTFDGGTHFRLATDVATILNPSGTFPSGHTVFIVNANAAGASNSITFDASGLNDTIVPTESSVYVYDADASAWVRLFEGTSAGSSANGASGNVQLSLGTGAFTSTNNLNFNTSSNELTVNGKLTVTGLIDPTGLELTPQSSNPVSGATAGNTLWLDSNNSNALMQGSTKVLVQGDADNSDFSLVGLNDTPANFTSAAGKILNVNSGANAVEFTTLSSLLNTDMGGDFTIGSQSDDTATFSGDLIVSGDLTVSGTTTTVNTDVLNVADNIIILNSDVTGAPSQDAGIQVERGTSTNVQFVWKESNDRWQFDNSVYVNNQPLTVTGTTTVEALVGNGDLQIDTDTLFVDVSEDKVGINQSSPLAPLHISNTAGTVGTGLGSNTANTLNSSTGTSIDVTLFHRDNFRAAKLLVEVENRTDDINETAEMVITHNGTDSSSATGAALTTFGVVQSDASQTVQASYDAAISGSNVQLEVTPTSDSKVIVVRVAWQALTRL